MKKGFLIPAALFAAVFCTSFLCQHYTLIFRENIGLFLLTPDWLKEVFTKPLMLSNFTGSFLGQFYAEPVIGPMIPAAVITIIYLCLNAFLLNIRFKFHCLAATIAALAAWYVTAGLSTPIAMTAIMLIALAMAAISKLPLLCKRKRGEAADKGSNRNGKPARPEIRWWEIIAAIVLIAGTAIFAGNRKSIRDNEEMARVVISTGKGAWSEVLKVATPDKVMERPVMMPFAMLALNAQTKLSETMFRYPVTGPESLDLAKEKNAIGNIFQSYLFEALGVPNEAIHQMFQFSTNFNHGMTHLSLCNLIRYNLDAGNYRMAAKYASILSHNLKYHHQAAAIAEKYHNAEDLTDSPEVESQVAPAFSQDAVYDMMQLFKNGHNSPLVVDRILAYFLLERNLEDFATLFYSYDWNGKNVPAHCQEALLLKGDIREGVRISPETARKYERFTKAIATMDIATAETLSDGTYWHYYYKETAGKAAENIQ